MFKLALYLVALVVVNAQLERCPNASLIKPCVCDHDDISCGGNENFDLKKVFLIITQALNPNQKTFNRFLFNNTAVKMIDTNTFYDITFHSIVISKAESLERIHTNAFSSSIYTLEDFDYNNYLINETSDNAKEVLINDPPNFNVFEMLSSFPKLRSVNFYSKLITSIPDNAFQPIFGLQNINRLELGYRKTLTTIGKNAFADLKNLTVLFLPDSRISYINAETFWFRNSSSDYLQIFLSNNTLNSSSFEPGTFNNIKRPFELGLENNKITYLDEKIFGPMFTLNSNNLLRLPNNPIDCSDCRNKWIINNKVNLEHRITDAKCNGTGKHFFDQTLKDFDTCK